MRTSTIARFVAVVGMALSIVLVGGGVAAADEGVPYGEPMTIRLSSGGQKALVAGVPVTAVAATCTFSGGTACAGATVLGAIAQPLLEEAFVCPDDGVREIVVQAYATSVMPIDAETNAYAATVYGDQIVHGYHRIVSDSCVPA
jgi:hypothetical protein